MRFPCGCEIHYPALRSAYSKLNTRTQWELCERHSSLMERVVDK